MSPRASDGGDRSASSEGEPSHGGCRQTGGQAGPGQAGAVSTTTTGAMSTGRAASGSPVGDVEGPTGTLRGWLQATHEPSEMTARDATRAAGAARRNRRESSNEIIRETAATLAPAPACNGTRTPAASSGAPGLEVHVRPVTRAPGQIAKSSTKMRALSRSTSATSPTARPRVSNSRLGMCTVIRSPASSPLEILRSSFT